MSIFDRMGRVISSNVNALLDKAEDPRKNMDLLAEEMREQIKVGRKELVEALGAEKMLKKKVEELDVEVARWEKRAELALKAGDEALAREALVQKKRVVGERDRAEALRGEQRSAALSMKAELDRMEVKQKDFEARKGTLAAQVQKARAGGGAEGLGAKGGSNAFDELRRMEAQIDGAEFEVTAHREVEDAIRGPGASSDSLESRFAALEGRLPGAAAGGVEVDDELAALKKKIRIGT